MKSVYRVLAFLVATGVVVQAASIAYGLFAMFDWADRGGTVDKALLESYFSGAGFPGSIGFDIHGVVGERVIPVLALLLLISSFFAKIAGGVKWAAIVLGVTVLQAALGIMSFALSVSLGWLHGINALILFGLAVSAAMRVRTTPAGAPVAARAAA